MPKVCRGRPVRHAKRSSPRSRYSWASRATRSTAWPGRPTPGSALHEVGKIDQDRLVGFLREHAGAVTRVTLRYATQKLPPGLRAEPLKRA
ncbi:DNA alkylation repair protein [Allokutzneria oryzae]|uniref:DNA alkylation repair protein n=1 Tax=Allokutzneria oryzae TaxID=1378989 RepID=A0ABV6A6U5_9PSEU